MKELNIKEICNKKAGQCDLEGSLFNQDYMYKNILLPRINPFIIYTVEWQLTECLLVLIQPDIVSKDTSKAILLHLL